MHLFPLPLLHPVVKINRQPDGPNHAAKALKRRLKSDNPKILQLTLTLCEAAVKNCSRPLHQALGQREFLAEVATLCNGQKGFEVRMDRFYLAVRTVVTARDNAVDPLCTSIHAKRIAGTVVEYSLELAH